MRLRSILLIAPAVLALAACGDGGGTEPPPPAGGDYNAVLQSPNGSESAALLELTGEGIVAVRSTGAFIASSPISGGRRVVLVRGTPGQLDFRITMSAGNGPPAVRVVEVAAPDDQLRASLGGYGVTFTQVVSQ